MSRKLTWIAVVVVAITVLFLAAVLLAPSRLPPPAPTPNGYDSFVKAGQALRKEDFAYEKATVEDLRQRLEEDRAALAMVRAGLKLESRVPAISVSQVETQLEQVGSFKTLMRALEAEARLAQADNRYAQAAEAGLDIVRLAHAGTQGGPMIFAMVGVALENRGLGVLERLRDAGALDPALRSNIVATLRHVDANSETVAIIMDNERAWARQVHGPKSTFLRLITHRQLQASETKFAALHQSVQARRKALITALQRQ